MRVSALITASLAVILALSLLPPASAQDGSVAEDPGSSSSPAAEAWEPGQLDVDWAQFARDNAAEYRSSSFAQADDVDGREARERLQAETAAAYAEATGADVPAAFQQNLDPSRTSAIAQQYYDECDDGTNLPDGGVQATRATLYSGGADTTGSISYNVGGPAPAPLIDLRSMFVLQSTDDRNRFDQTAFLMYACQEWATADLGPGGITFGLYTNFESGEEQYPTVLGDPETGPDFIVSIFPEPAVPERPIQIMAIRTPSRDPATWTLTHLDEARRLDGFVVDGTVPTSALGDFTADSGFAWTVEVEDAQQPTRGRDWFPERNYLLRVGEGEDAEVGTHIPQFPVPDACGIQRESSNDFVLTPQQVTPNDDGYPQQWYHPQVRSPQAWDTIRDSSAGGRSRPVTVAVVDTGIDATRFDFLDGGPRVVAGFDAVYGLELEGGDNGGAIGPFLGPRAVGYETFGATPPPRNSDRDPHGTGVASLIGARGNNTFGIAGMDWGVRLMPIRVNDINGCITSTTVADGIKWAADHGADIIHISLAATDVGTVDAGDDPDRPGVDGVPECADGLDNDGNGLIDHDGGPLGPEFADPDCDGPNDPREGPEAGTSRDPLRETIDYALEKGVPVVAAAGNFGSLDDPVIYPAAYPGVITVGATDRSGERAFYSSTGRWLDVVAPGGDNSGTLAGDLAVLWELDRIRSVAGTSFSAPIVTGALSLYMGLNPHITRAFRPSPTPPDPAGNMPTCIVEADGVCRGYTRTVDDLRIAVQNGVQDLAPRGHDGLTGWGRLDVDRMLDVNAVGGPLADPSRAQLPRTNADAVIEAAEGVALSRPLVLPPFVLLSRSDVAVDALSASPLLADGPLLVATRAGVAPSTLQVMDELMPGGGLVYLLGGTNALPPHIEEQLVDAGHRTIRLAGESRFETAVVIAEEARRLGADSSQVGIVRADGGDDPTAQWADALTGGAWAAASRMPVLVTGTDDLHPDAAAALERWGTQSTTVFGGTAAISDSVMARLPGPTRIAGDSRDATAVAIADRFFADSDGAVVVNGFYARGWVPGLAAAGWAADLDRPLLYTGARDVPTSTADLLQRRCHGVEGIQIVGGASFVTGSAEAALMEAVTC
jgi:putative cell wall-binding protein